MLITACNPEEHCLFNTYNVDVSGNPAKNYAILAVLAPDPFYKTFPMQISSTFLGSIPVCLTTSFNTVASIISGGVSFYAPLFDLVIAVLAIPTITTSSSLGAVKLPAFIVWLADICESNLSNLYIEVYIFFYDDEIEI